jgi:eukaryotic-like serine/threonine-protein kinase
VVDDTEATESLAGAPTAGSRPGAPTLARGTCIGRYVVLDRLGQGGMGVVYRAYDPDLDRRVAIKLVRDLHDDATARLIREAQALAKVSHPNIVQVFDVGLAGDDVFIAMELVVGRTLSQWHEAARPTWRVTVAHLLEAARGLAAAHAAGLIHRDFKPNNTVVGADGRVRVLDFGLARVVGGAGEGDGGELAPELAPWTPSSELSRRARERSGEPSAATVHDGPRTIDEGTTDPEDAGLPRVLASRVIGTPVYMAPEQRRRGAIDARADQFAFAVTAWELLYGERPFAGTSSAAYAEAAATGALRPAPPGTPVPAWVRRALVRALAPLPADRYRSMDELIAALSADPSARRRRWAALALVTAIAGAAAVALSVWGGEPRPCGSAARHLGGVWDRDVRARLDAAFRATRAAYAADTASRVAGALDARAGAWIAMHTEACEATHLRGEQSAAMLDLRMGCLARRRDELRALVDELVRAPDAERLLEAVGAVARLPEVEACADRDALTTVVPPPRDPTVRAAIDEERRELARIGALIDTGQWAEGRARAERAVTRARQLGWAPLEAEASYRRGLAERHGGDLVAAEAALRAAGRAAARAHLDDVAAEIWTELVWVVGYEGGRPLEGLALAHAAGAFADRADAPPRVRAALHQARAMALAARGELDEALAEIGAALALAEARSGAASPEAAEMANSLAMILSQRGDYAAAEAGHRRALASREAAYGSAHPKVGDSLDNLGVVLAHQGRRAEARAYYQQALALRLAALGPEHRDVGTSHNNLGSLALDEGDERAATAHLERALALYERTLGAGHPDLAIPLSNLGDLAIRRGDFVRALDYCRRALVLDEAAAGPDAPDLAYDLVCVGEAELGRGDRAAARPLLERALALRTGGAGDPGELARTRFALARALWGLGDRPRARQLAIEARDGLAALGDAWADRHAAVVAWLARPR